MGNARIQIKRGSAAFWDAENPVLFPGEPGVEMWKGHPSKLKIGDGETPWRELPYSPTTMETPSGGETPVDLADHINDPTPHPAYDEGPSLNLLYTNAKV
jgi:hypothetical protein